MILAGHGKLVETAPYAVEFSIAVEPHQQEVSEMFLAALEAEDGADPVEIRAITVLLFLSMTPLHVDRPMRQLQLAVNALRLAEGLPSRPEGKSRAIVADEVHS